MNSKMGAVQSKVAKFLIAGCLCFYLGTSGCGNKNTGDESNMQDNMNGYDSVASMMADSSALGARDTMHDGTSDTLDQRR